MNTVTPWTATAQADIETSKPLFERRMATYAFKFYNTGDSLWVTVEWPEGGSIAFRTAFGMNSVFEDVAIEDVPDGYFIRASTRLANYEIRITFPDHKQPVFRYTTTFEVAFPMLIPFWPRDIVPLTKEGRVENTFGNIHSHQVGGRSGQIFFSMMKPRNGSVFYFQNLTAMTDYCEASETSLVETVGGRWPEIGFKFPINVEKPLPAKIKYTISDAFVVLSENIPASAEDVTRQYLDYLAKIYLLIPRPETIIHDWPDIAKKGIEGLYNNKGCWTLTNGIPYLNAYVGDYKTPTEIMVQLAVLLPLCEYMEWSGEKHPLFADLNSGLDAFYDERVKTIVRWHPALEDDLDKSEEQKREMVMDSWYLHHPMLNLCRLALKGDKLAKELFLKSIDFAVKVAHHFDYEWPVFYKMTTLEVLKEETAPGKGGELDVPGSYAHLMLMAWKLTQEKRFLNEAVKAVKKLEGIGFQIFYQANNTAFTAGALLELYRETKDNKYLELSYSCLAGIFKNVQLWDCNYGYGKSCQNFFAVFPLNDAPYTAAYEELEVYAALHHYLQMAEGIDILPSLRILIPEFIKYTVSRLPYYYPPMLPADMIDDNVKTGEVQKDLWVPLEDIHDGWEKSGGVGQEVYGAGIAFGVLPRQYIKAKAGFTIFIDYPFYNLRHGAETITFTIIGDPSLECSLALIDTKKQIRDKITVEYKRGTKYVNVENCGSITKPKYKLSGNALVRITWK
jgi:hypothetical protein